MAMPQIIVAVITAILAQSNALRKSRSASRSSWGYAVPPGNQNLRAIGVVMNPGGLVGPRFYEEHMNRWQAEAEKVGLSMWFAILDYWFDLPIPIRLEANIRDSINGMEGKGLPANAPIFLTGHSFGGAVLGPAARTFMADGIVWGQILQASYIRYDEFPPVADSVTFPVPTLTIGADLNFGSARITRMAAARYRQRGMSDANFPFAMIQGMNHMQFASGYEKEDLRPEIDTATAQQKVAELSAEFMANQLGMGGNSNLLAETRRADAVFAPIITAFELEGDSKFNGPNQKSAPNNSCPRGVCPTSSPWVEAAQAEILGKEIMDSVRVVSNYADLNPFVFEEREERKPFISDDLTTVQTYLMASNTVSDFEDDTTTPVASKELLAKMISREEGALKVLRSRLGRDDDMCMKLNQMAFDRAMQLASPLARQRYDAHGQTMVFKPTNYQAAGPLWTGSELKYEERDGFMMVTSSGLYTAPGDSLIDGNHYCKLLTPARALEWIYVDGLEKELWAIWET